MKAARRDEEREAGEKAATGTSGTTARDRGQRRAVVFVLAAAAFGWFFWPRTASLRRFDPEAMASLEARMWRSYYEHRRLALVADLYAMSRDQYGFSPWDSVRLAKYSGSAALAFPTTNNRLVAVRALLAMERYFGFL